MKFFLDENFPKSAERYLVSRGHTVFDIRGSSDEGIDWIRGLFIRIFSNDGHDCSRGVGIANIILNDQDWSGLASFTPLYRIQIG